MLFLLFVGEDLAGGVEDLKEGNFVLANPTAYLAECAENPQDIVLACTAVFHLLKLFGDRVRALAKE